MIPAAVVFDCDGVLVDSEPHSIAAWLAVLGRIGHPAPRSAVEECTGLGFAPTYEALSILGPLPPREVLWPDVLGELEHSFRSGLEVFTDAAAVIDRCAGANVPVAVASASPRSRLDLTLGSAGLAHRFAVSVAGDEVVNGKPAPDVYLAAAAGLRVRPDECVAVEDTPTGAAAALAAGMSVVAVARREADRRDLAATGAVVVGTITAGDLGL